MNFMSYLRDYPKRGKMSVACHYSGLCCTFHADGWRWGNKRRGSCHKNSKRKTLRTHRSNR